VLYFLGVSILLIEAGIFIRFRKPDLGAWEIEVSILLIEAGIFIQSRVIPSSSISLQVSILLIEAGIFIRYVGYVDSIVRRRFQSS